MAVTFPLGRLTAQFLATALTLSGTVACSTQAASNADAEATAGKTTSPEIVTTFKCIELSNTWATLAQRGSVISISPLITWNSLEFGSDYTPEKRCGIVSRKLTEAVAQNGGILAGLDLTTGKVDDGQSVVCLLSKGQSSCDRNNMLFTLNRENSQNPSEVLNRITNFAQGQAYPKSITEKANLPSIISLETLVNRSLPKGNGF